MERRGGGRGDVSRRRWRPPDWPDVVRPSCHPLPPGPVGPVLGGGEAGGPSLCIPEALGGVCH